MLFNSIQFGIFFVVTTTFFFAMGARWRPWLLLIASCYFYAAFIPKYLLVLFALILVDFFAAQGIEKAKKRNKKFLLVVSLVANLGLLFVFKYAGFFRDSFVNATNFFGLDLNPPLWDLILPIGLSFHTFQSLAYVIEVYRGKYRAERDLKTYALYVLFFPQMVAGPIERPGNLLPQLKKETDFDYERVVMGLRRMLWGFFKKLVIADNAAIVVNQIFSNPAEYHGWSVIAAVYLFAIQIYCDFSGYSDIAIGAARIMGYDLMVNFRQPYAAKTVQEFWQRWHISLSTWFRDYLYIPLGGSRRGRWINYRNIIVVFTLSGFWHGANWTFVLWGLWHGCFLILERLWTEKIPAWANRIIGLQIVAAGWIFFRANSVLDVGTIFRNAFNFREGLKEFTLGLGTYRFTCLIVAIAVMFTVESLESSTKEKTFLRPKSTKLRWAAYYGLTFGILLFGAFSKTNFIYFQF